MPAKQVAQYVCDTEDYRAMWTVRVWPWVCFPVATVALIVLAFAMVF